MADILKPSEVKRRRQNPVSIGFEEEPVESINQELIQTSGKVKIELESMGRFGSPAVVYFSDYYGKDIHDIILSPQEDLLQNLLIILNKNKTANTEFDCLDLTGEDLLEILIAIQIQFDTPFITHHWVCECQRGVEENDQIVHEIQLNLNEINYKSIEDNDKELKEFFKSLFDRMNDEQFKNYLYRKYKNNPLDDIESWTKEKELNTIKIKEPFTILHGNDSYQIRYPRIKDIINAKKYVYKKYNPKIKSVQNRKEAGVPLHELKVKKEEEIQKLKLEMGKLIILYAKSQILLAKNGVEYTDEQKLNEYSEGFERTLLAKFDDLLAQIKFGVQHEIELTCPLCGKSERRSLQHFLDPRELLPYGDGRKPKVISTSRESDELAGLNFYFGA